MNATAKMRRPKHRNAVKRPTSGSNTNSRSSAKWALRAIFSSSGTSCRLRHQQAHSGRGARDSACGAIVSYVLKLSNVCPLRSITITAVRAAFLDPNRAEQRADIDIDFCQDRREEVIQYVREKYGEQSVAQIGTFGTMAAKAAIKDVGRVLDIPLERVVRLTAMVPKVLNITLAESLQQSPDLKREYDGDAAIRKLIDTAMKLEGTNHCLRAPTPPASSSPTDRSPTMCRCMRITQQGRQGRGHHHHSMGDGRSRKSRHVEDGLSWAADLDRRRERSQAHPQEGGRNRLKPRGEVLRTPGIPKGSEYLTPGLRGHCRIHQGPRPAHLRTADGRPRQQCPLTDKKTYELLQRRRRAASSRSNRTASASFFSNA